MLRRISRLEVLGRKIIIGVRVEREWVENILVSRLVYMNLWLE